MAVAAFDIYKRLDGSTEVNTSKNPGFLSANLHTTPASYRVAIPAADGDAANRSFENWLQLVCTVAPDTAVENLKVYGPALPIEADPGDAANPFVYVKIGTADIFATPVVTASTVATARVDTTHFSVATALAIPIDTGDGVINAIGERSDFIVPQLIVNFGATDGPIPRWSLILAYEES